MTRPEAAADKRFDHVDVALAHVWKLRSTPARADEVHHQPMERSDGDEWVGRQ